MPKELKPIYKRRPEPERRIPEDRNAILKRTIKDMKHSRSVSMARWYLEFDGPIKCR